MIRLVFLCLSLLSIISLAQDVDTIVLKNDRQKFTLVSQIQDPKEAAAFLTLLRTTEPQARHSLAQEFLRAYPQSWLLPQVYDVSARSAIDLTKYDDALVDGRFSLRLLPENPSLLILMANLEAQQNLAKRAMQDASDALEYLNQIERPPNMTQDEWDALRPQLKSSAYFAKARIEASRALGNAHDAAALQEAQHDLDNAAAWNPDDPEIFYLRAIAELQLHQQNAAVADLTFVAENSQALSEKATKILAILPHGGSIQTRKIDQTLRRDDSQNTRPEVLTAGYAGPERCQGCHVKEYDAWRKTGMARMLQPYQRENVRGDFSPSSHYNDTIRMGFLGRPYFEIADNGKWDRFYVDFTIGSKWQQGYATKLPDGRLQVLPIEYNMLQKKWINYWKMIDPPGSARAVIEDFPKLTSATNYQQNCAICHTSQLTMDPSSLQPGINCEMCHGPSAFHVKHPSQLPFNFKTANNRDGVRVCAQCHRQSSVREVGDHGEMNYSTKVNFVASTTIRSYDAFSRKAFYKDGRFRETTFIVDAFTRSACYLRGTAQCASCHSPHLSNFEENRTSLKYADKPNEMCLSCHSQYRDRIEMHTRHAANTEASQCVSCHMPRIMNALLFKARSHKIEIPTADLTERFGQQESPNVCLACHPGKDVTWAKGQLAAWPK